jgi:hypothetical protein
MESKGSASTRGSCPIRLDAETMKALESHEKKMKLEKMKYADVYEDNSLVVCTRFGGPVFSPYREP